MKDRISECAVALGRVRGELQSHRHDLEKAESELFRIWQATDSSAIFKAWEKICEVLKYIDREALPELCEVAGALAEAADSEEVAS